MKLSLLLKNIAYQSLRPIPDCDISGIAYDSRRVRAGYLFVCIKGLKTDGHFFVQEAIKNGAIAVLCENYPEIQTHITMIRTENTRGALAALAANFYGNPSNYLKLIGVTGTNGKTSVAYMIKAILDEAGYKVGIMGTLSAAIDSEVRELGHTTPESLEIEEFLADCVQRNADFVVMEVSSHALALQRVKELNFHCAIFTNLTQDHLDFHHNMTAYRDSKLELFQLLANKPGAFGVINADDDYSGDFINSCPVPVYTYGLSKDATVKADITENTLRGVKFVASRGEEKLNIQMSLIGGFSVYNSLAAITFAYQEGVKAEIIKKSLRKLRGVTGRFEQVDCGQEFTVIVDYAHTPDGLQNVLLVAREIVEKRIITVFGCGGDRDRGKRPLMGQIAARNSDFIIVTTDNPRSEEPEDIIADIVPGIETVPNSRYAIIVDRYEAIRHAINLAKKNDMVIITGKGHETYQLVKDQILEFDDRKVASALIKERAAHGL